jgi:hypothetical protein
VRFEVIGTAARSTVRARVDRRRRRTVTSPLRLPRLSVGRHRLRLRAQIDGSTVAKRTVRFRIISRGD